MGTAEFSIGSKGSVSNGFGVIDSCLRRNDIGNDRLRGNGGGEAVSEIFERG